MIYEKKNISGFIKYHINSISPTSSFIIYLIKAICGQLVLLGHSISFLNIFLFLQPPYLPYIQNLAVLVFFFLSGFLIASSVVRKKLKKNYSFKIYFTERLTRIYSGFLPAILFVLVLDVIHIYIDSKSYNYFPALNFYTFLGNIFMFQDHPFLGIFQMFKLPNVPINAIKYFQITSFGSARPFWTLSIEWWIYLFYGWLIIKQRKKLLSYIILLLLSVIPFYNLINGRGNGLTLVWLMGVGVYYLSLIYFKISDPKSLYFAAFFFLIFLYQIYITKSDYNVFNAVIFALFFLFLFGYSQTIQINISSLIYKLIKYLADSSYILYLIHYSILDFINQYKYHYSPYILFCFSIILPNIIALVLTKYTVEKRSNIFRFLKRNVYNLKGL